jgi:hypothetical protein
MVLAAGTAFASPGVGVNLGSITVNDALKPGGSYPLPAIGVINTGDEARVYAVSVQRVDLQGTKEPDADWFHFEPEQFVLNPGETRDVGIRLELPTGADSGDYAAHLEAHPVNAGSQSVGIAVATKLEFSVKPASWLDAQSERLNRWLDESTPWSYLVAGGLVLGFAATRARRLPFRLRIERR